MTAHDNQREFDTLVCEVVECQTSLVQYTLCLTGENTDRCNFFTFIGGVRQRQALALHAAERVSERYAQALARIAELEELLRIAVDNIREPDRDSDHEVGVAAERDLGELRKEDLWDRPEPEPNHPGALWGAPGEDD